VKIAETAGIHWNECQPALVGGHKGFCSSRLGGKMGDQQEDEKESGPPCCGPC
jgi:hypothetical protein